MPRAANPPPEIIKVTYDTMVRGVWRHRAAGYPAGDARARQVSLVFADRNTAGHVEIRSIERNVVLSQYRPRARRPRIFPPAMPPGPSPYMLLMAPWYGYVHAARPAGARAGNLKSCQIICLFFALAGLLIKGDLSGFQAEIQRLFVKEAP